MLTKWVTFHDFIAGFVLIIGIVGVMALVVLERNIPDLLTVIVSTALGYLFRSAVVSAEREAVNGDTVAKITNAK